MGVRHENRRRAPSPRLDIDDYWKGVGNDEVSFDRNACLHLNDEITEIATSANGLALYFTEHGLKVLKRSHTLPHTQS